MYFYCKERGFTLIELIVTIAILVIIVTLAIPSYHQFKAQQELKTVRSLVKQFLSTAKNNAVTYHSIVVICASSDLKQCQNHQWNSGIILFNDQNNNEKIDENELIHSRHSTHFKYGELKWKGGVTSTQILTFQNDTGLPRGAPGSFRYCSFYDPQLSKRFVISPMGQVREEALAC